MSANVRRRIQSCRTRATWGWIGGAARDSYALAAQSYLAGDLLEGDILFQQGLTKTKEHERTCALELKAMFHQNKEAV